MGEMVTDAYRERRYIREDIVDTFRATAAALTLAREPYEKASHACAAARQAFIAEVEAVARGRVRRAHTDWFHPNGDKRGAFRQQIEGAFRMTCFELWDTLFPQDDDATWDMDTHSPFPAPPLPVVAETPAQREERMAASHASEARREAASLALEDDPERRDRFIWARVRLDALDADPQVSAAWAAYEAACAAYSTSLRAQARRDMPDAAQREEWQQALYAAVCAAADDPALKAQRTAWYELSDAEKELTMAVLCQECGNAERINQSAIGTQLAALRTLGGGMRYRCAACERAARREKLRVARAARQTAQRMAQLKVLDQQPPEDRPEEPHNAK